jgi:putative membrane protein
VSGCNDRQDSWSIPVSEGGQIMVKTSCSRAVAMLLAAAACGVVQAQGVADPPAAARSGEEGKLTRAERRFMEQAARHGQAEIQLGHLAQTRAASERVKHYARRMVEDHTRSVQELSRIAADEGVKLPASMDRNHERMLGDLRNTAGADFDRRFITEMVKVHERDLKGYERAARQARDPELKAFAEKAARGIEQHLTQARQIAETVVGASGPRRSALRPGAASAGASAPPRSGAPSGGD